MAIEKKKKSTNFPLQKLNQSKRGCPYVHSNQIHQYWLDTKVNICQPHFLIRFLTKIFFNIILQNNCISTKVKAMI